MIAVDTSTLVAYLGGGRGRDVDLLHLALSERQVCLPPVVLTEILGASDLPGPAASLLASLPRLEADAGYW